MATFTGIFEFDDGSTQPTAPGNSGSFTENGVTFSFSVTNTNNTDPSVSYFPAGQGGDGVINFLENHSLFTPTFFIFAPTSADATLTLDIVNTNGFSRFSGALSVKAFSVIDEGTFQVWNNGTKIGTLSPGNRTVTTPSAAGSSIKFINSTASGPGSSRLQLDSINGTVNCFCAGTRVATPHGNRAVETLTPGDRLLTAAGGETTLTWLGVQPIDARLTHPAKVNPIRITAGALGDGLPARDLDLSADHAIAIDGHLINAGALVNGRTIYQIRDMPLDGFTYYHVETEGGHELLLAEGVAAESFIDYAGADSFVNGDARDGAVIPEMDLPRISAARMVPDPIRAVLAERADALTRRAA